MQRLDLERSMYELRDASIAQRVTLATIGAVCVALAWWLLLGGGARNRRRLARVELEIRGHSSACFSWSRIVRLLHPDSLH